MIALDCTLRDGGYHTNWEFDLGLVRLYLKTMEQSGIDAVELGLRSPPGKEIGAYGNVTDGFILEGLAIPEIRYLGVMVNASEIYKIAIKTLFEHEDNSPINLVRVATHFKDIDLAERACKELKNLGYTVSIQLMQAADKSYDEIASAARNIRSWDAVDVLYLADSLGGMSHDSIDYAYSAIKSEWGGLTGFHAHNNKGQALNNTLEAVDIGVDWVDGTVAGMGRGPGNAEIEYLLGELNKRGYGEYELKQVYDLAFAPFYRMKEYYQWGASLPYYLSAEYSIHPTYIQNLLHDGWDSSVILDVIYSLSNKESNSFNKVLLEEAIDECRHNNPS